jgi:GDP-D-mannose dehydratase
MINKQKVPLITGIARQDSCYLAKFMLEKGYIFNGFRVAVGKEN